MTLWLTICAMGAVTYATRLLPLLVMHRLTLPPFVQRALRLAPIAALSAIIGPELARPGGTLDLSFANARLLAGLLAILVAWRTRNIIATILVGMAALWLLQLLLP